MIREFSISAGHTFSPKQYESYRVDASLTVTVNETDSYEDLKAKAQITLHELLVETYKAHQRKTGNGQMR